jgi:CRP-like cAMP-binding protein
MKARVTPEQLRSIPLFAGLSAAGLERVSRTCGELEAPDGQVLALPDDPGSGMFVILDGSVVVEVRSGSFRLGEGEVFGELALFAPDAARVARVRAAGPVRCLAIPREEALALVESEPKLALALLGIVSQRLVDARTV